MSMWDEPEPALEEGLVNRSGSDDEAEPSDAPDAGADAAAGGGDGKLPAIEQNALQPEAKPDGRIVPSNPAEAGGGKFAMLVALAGFSSTAFALVFSRMVSAAGEIAAASLSPSGPPPGGCRARSRAARSPAARGRAAAVAATRSSATRILRRRPRRAARRARGGRAAGVCLPIGRARRSRRW